MKIWVIMAIVLAVVAVLFGNTKYRVVNCRTKGTGRLYIDIKSRYRSVILELYAIMATVTVVTAFCIEFESTWKSVSQFVAAVILLGIIISGLTYCVFLWFLTLVGIYLSYARAYLTKDKRMRAIEAQKKDTDNNDDEAETEVEQHSARG